VADGPAKLAPGYEYELVPASSLTNHPRNARRGNVERIRRLIRENGYVSPVVAQRSSGHVIVGNHRFRAAVAEGIDQVPCIWVDVPDARAEAMAVSDNVASDDADWDRRLLLDVLRDLDEASDVPLEASGLDVADMTEVARLTGELADESVAWLDRIIERSRDGAGDVSDDGTQRDGQRHDRTFDLTFPLDERQRALVLDAVAAAKQAGASTSGEAIVAVCAAYLEPASS